MDYRVGVDALPGIELRFPHRPAHNLAIIAISQIRILALWATLTCFTSSGRYDGCSIIPFRAAKSSSLWCSLRSSGTERDRLTGLSIRCLPYLPWTLLLTGSNPLFRKIPDRVSFGNTHRSVWSNVRMTTSWRKPQCLNKSLPQLFHTPKSNVGTLEPNPETLCRLKTGKSYGQEGEESVADNIHAQKSLHSERVWSRMHVCLFCLTALND